jgi:hypothetical protein
MYVYLATRMYTIFVYPGILVGVFEQNSKVTDSLFLSAFDSYARMKVLYSFSLYTTVALEFLPVY